MSRNLKTGLYVVLTAVTCLFGYLFYTNYTRLADDSSKSPQSTSLDMPSLEKKSGSAPGRGYSRAMMFGGIFVLVLLAMGLLAGHDISQTVGNRVLKTLYNDERAGEKDPDYELAEQAWADGQHLEAVRLMREYLQKNPREQHVAIRIAEIYEKDLHNNLAAALEYEEVLQHKLPPDRWGWSAIHLCNLYFKLGHSDKAVALLRRVDAEYGETAAAEKARKRLALIDGNADGSAAADTSPVDDQPASGAA
jgi:hypothetical protein